MRAATPLLFSVSFDEVFKPQEYFDLLSATYFEIKMSWQNYLVKFYVAPDPFSIAPPILSKALFLQCGNQHDCYGHKLRPHHT